MNVTMGNVTFNPSKLLRRRHSGTKAHQATRQIVGQIGGRDKASALAGLASGKKAQAPQLKREAARVSAELTRHFNA